MTSLLSRAIAAIRAWMGLDDPADERLSPPHGWLLPPSHALELALTLSPIPVSTTPGRRR